MERVCGSMGGFVDMLDVFGSLGLFNEVKIGPRIETAFQIRPVGDEAHELQIDLPGCSPSSMEVVGDDKAFLVSWLDRDGHHKSERFAWGQNHDCRAARAKYALGVLTVVVPVKGAEKPKPAEPTTIAIETA